MKKVVFIILCLIVAYVFACVGRPNVGMENEPCSKEGNCMPGLACGPGNICMQPGSFDGSTDDAAIDGGGIDDDGGTNASIPG
jgi:hypothetical protein